MKTETTKTGSKQLMCVGTATTFAYGALRAWMVGNVWFASRGAEYRPTGPYRTKAEALTALGVGGK
jgi:hypothetical protein